MHNAIQISDNVYFVGAVDYDVRSFHGYSTTRGATYNAYLIMDTQITLIDTVKAPFTAEMLERISSVIDPSKIDNIICNHAEFDHSGALRTIYELSKAKIFCTAMGAKILTTLYGDMNYNVVALGEKITSGKFSFNFLPTPMVHWPDNMVTYCPDQKILFSNDAFGQHIATSTRLDTNTNFADVLAEAKKYYANIVMPYAANVAKALAAVEALQLKMIAPSHGVVLTQHIPQILQMYKELSFAKKDGSAVVVYDSMWGGTKQLASQIGAAFEKVCPSVTYFDLKANDLSDIMTRVASASFLAVGSPTLNNTMLPNVAAFLTYLKGLRPTGLKYVAFGTFGWAGGAIKEICATLDALKYPQIATYTANFLPTPQDLTAILQLNAPHNA